MPDRPNIVLIITDQQRYDTIQALGFPYMDTPNLDRLAAEGTSFSNCFVTAPSCVPSRASLFNGYYPHTTGIFSNADSWRRSWVESLASAGYHCVNIGKMHTVPYGAETGFHERYVVENKDRYLDGRYYFDEWDRALAANGLVKQQRESYRKLPDYKNRLGAFEWELPEELHSDLFVGGMARWWLKSYPKTEPLFFEIGFPGPHPPYDPSKRYAAPYLKKDLPILEPSQAEIRSQPPPLREMIKHNCEVDHDSIVHNTDPTPVERHRQRAYYLANITMIDEQIGRILATLDTQGYLENSVVIFTSDHGDCLGDHGHSQKWTMYDTILRVPTIIWSPGRFAEGAVIPELFQNMDIGPTILEIAGLTIPDSYEAISMLPALTGKDTQVIGREYIYAEHGPDNVLQSINFMTAIRSRLWKLVHFSGESFGQLFDLETDPDELVNLWESREHQAKREELLTQLREWLISSNYQTRGVRAGLR